jgi:internalin A
MNETNSIQLTTNCLTVIPLSKITKKANLKTLNLNNNQIKEIPREIKELTALTSLNLSKNQIEIIPVELS